MNEYSLRDLYKKPSYSIEADRTTSDNVVFVQYTPRTFYFALNGRFAALTTQLSKRRKRRLLGKLKGHIRTIKCFVSRNKEGLSDG